MKTYFIFLGIITVLATSCTSMYKTGQTPDDVYYAPAKPDINYGNNSNIDNEDYYSYRDDQYLRMKAHNRRWSTIDDFGYWNPSVTVGYGWSSSPWGYPTYSNPWTYSHPYWNNYSYGYSYYDPYNPWYNPYYGYGPVIIVNKYPSAPARNTRSTLGGYQNNNGYNNTNNRGFNKNSGNYESGRYNNNNTIYTPNRTTTTDNSNRTYNPSNSNSNSNGGATRQPRKN